MSENYMTTRKIIEVASYDIHQASDCLLAHRFNRANYHLKHAAQIIDRWFSRPTRKAVE